MADTKNTVETDIVNENSLYEAQSDIVVDPDVLSMPLEFIIKDNETGDENPSSDSEEKSTPPVFSEYSDDTIFSLMQEIEKNIAESVSSGMLKADGYQSVLASYNSPTPSTPDTTATELSINGAASFNSFQTNSVSFKSLSPAGPLGVVNDIPASLNTFKFVKPSPVIVEAVTPSHSGSSLLKPLWYQDLFPDAPAQRASYSINHQNPTPLANENFGIHYKVAGENIFIHTPNDNYGGYAASGSIYMYDMVTGNLINTLVNPTPANNEGFGSSEILIHDNTAIVSLTVDMNGGYNYSGAVYLYDVQTGNLINSILNPTPYSMEFFGKSKMIVDDTLIIASSDRNGGQNNSGAVYLYDLQTGNLKYSLINPTPAANDYFGNIMVAKDNFLVTSSVNDSYSGYTNAGSVYIYDINTGSLLHHITDPNSSSYTLFGQYFNIIDDKLTVYAANSGTTNHQGVLYLYDLATGNLLHTFNNPTPNNFDYFGQDYIIVDNNMFIRASGDNDGFSNSGTVYQYDLTSYNLINVYSNPTPGAADRFGRDAIFTDNHLMIAPVYADDNNGFNNNGVIHIFDTISGNLLHTIENPIPGNSVEFGKLIHVENDFMTVFSPYANLNGHASAGAVFVYNINSGELLHEIHNPTPDEYEFFGLDGSVVENVLLPKNRTIYSEKNSLIC